MKPPISRIVSRIFLLAASFVVLAVAITSRPPKWLSDFDQSFYLTIAYDVEHYGVFSNGIFDKTDRTQMAPTPGMFFMPGYPLLVVAVMGMDSRFSKAVECSVEANIGKRNGSECEVYARPIHVVHGFLLALGVLAIALCGELIFGSIRVFWLSGMLATGSLVVDTDLFSFAMTESMTISLYSIFALFILLAWKTSRLFYAVLAGISLGLLCLTRPSFVVLIPVVLVLIVLNGRRIPRGLRTTSRDLVVFAAACLVVLGPWMVRNHLSVGKWGLTEEYGSAALIERFAYNDMTMWEFMLAFPYCTPGIGDIAFDQVDGKDAMHRFVYHTPDSFFHAGRARRDTLVQAHGRLDPLIAGIVLDEMRANWWRHLLVSIPLGWCGMWVGWLWGLLLIPLFGWALVHAVRQSQPLLLLYTAPAIAMLCLHAVIANQYTRYNLILIGPFAVGAASLISAWLPNARWRNRGADAHSGDRRS